MKDLVRSLLETLAEHIFMSILQRMDLWNIILLLKSRLVAQERMHEKQFYSVYYLQLHFLLMQQIARPSSYCLWVFWLVVVFFLSLLCIYNKNIWLFNLKYYSVTYLLKKKSLLQQSGNLHPISDILLKAFQL